MHLIHRLLGKTETEKPSINDLDRVQKQLNDLTRYIDMLKKQRITIDKQIENFTKMHHDLSQDLMNMGK